MMQEISITSEDQAAVAILFASAMSGGHTLNQSQIEQLSRMLVLSSRFKSSSLNELTVQALSLQSQYGSRVVIEKSAPLIDPDFGETLFAMCCELVTADGKVDETESEVLAMIALYLGMKMESMKMILSAFLIRNRWNVQIIENQE